MPVKRVSSTRRRKSNVHRRIRAEDRRRIEAGDREAAHNSRRTTGTHKKKGVKNKDG